VLASPAVRALWLAGTGSGVMRWLEVLAFGLYALAETGSPLAVALTSFARFLPLLLFGAPLGVLAERLDRRRLLVWSYAAMALVEACAAGSAWLGLLDLWQVALVGVRRRGPSGASTSRSGARCSPRRAGRSGWR
jgi:MFS family permease